MNFKLLLKEKCFLINFMFMQLESNVDPTLMFLRWSNIDVFTLIQRWYFNTISTLFQHWHFSVDPTLLTWRWNNIVLLMVAQFMYGKDIIYFWGLLGSISMSTKHIHYYLSLYTDFGAFLCIQILFCAIFFIKNQQLLPLLTKNRFRFKSWNFHVMVFIFNFQV